MTSSGFRRPARRVGLAIVAAGLCVALGSVPVGAQGPASASGLTRVLDRVESTVATNPPSASVASLVTGLTEIKRGFTKPVLVTHAHDSRLFVVEQGGLIKVMKPSSSGWTVVSTPFLDVSANLPDPRGGDQGLLGLAFPPDYATGGRFYVYYTNGSGDNLVAEYRRSTNPDRADAATRRLVIKIPHTPPGTQHNGGMIAFGPNDGYLYIGTGDGKGSGLPDEEGNAQDPGSLLGKILRIDVGPTSGYAIPADNPFVGVTGARGEVWAVGLRNPWRWSFDRSTGKMWIGDVGYKTYEEVSRSSTGRGANFGWRCYEGRHQLNNVTGVTPCTIPADDRTDPIIEYTHSGARCAVTGGYVYRGTKYPSLVGRYVWADFCSGELWDISSTATNPAALPTPRATGVNISSFGEGSNGELYAVGLYAPGIIYKVRG